LRGLKYGLHTVAVSLPTAFTVGYLYPRYPFMVASGGGTCRAFALLRDLARQRL